MKVRTHLALMAGAVLIPVVIFSAISLNTLLRAEREAAYRSMLETARNISLNTDGELKNAENSLRILALSDSLKAGDLARFYGKAATLNQDEKSWTILLNRNGEQILNTAAPFGARLPAAMGKNGVTQVLQANAHKISNLLVGPLTKKFVIAVGYPVTIDAKRQYVLAQSFTIDYFDRVFPSMPNRPGWLMGIFDREGRTISRSRQPHKGLIGELPNPNLLNAIRAQRHGIFRSQSRDGSELYAVLVRSPLSGWTVAVGVPVDEVESAARRAVIVSAIGLFAAILCAAAFAAVIGHRLMDSVADAVRSALELGKGKTPVGQTSRIDEFNALHAAHREAGALLERERISRLGAEEDRQMLLLREQIARQDAETENQLKDQFLAMLGHEIRNPLSGIAAATAVLRSENVRPEQKQHALDILQRQGDHLAHIIDDLLDVARVSTGKITLGLDALDLASVAAHCLENFSVAGRLEAYVTNLSTEPAWIMADKTRIEQIVNNLLGNAIKFTQPGGLIDIAVAVQNADAVLTVRDTGIGIAPDLLPRIFDIFTQGAASLDRSQGGLGIGLALVRQLVEMHGGSVTAESLGNMAGSTFTVRIPLASAGSPASSDPRMQPLSRSYRILLVEDNPNSREMMVMALQMQGHQIYEAANGLDAIRLARAHLPEVAIVDIGLPDISGYEVVRSLRRDTLTQKMLLIALTGYGLESDKEQSLAAGFDFHMVKPFRIQDILRLIGQHLSD